VVDSSANATKRVTYDTLSAEVRDDVTPADFTLTSGDLPAGSIVQVVQAETTTEVTNTTSTYVATGLSASITPTSNTNKILVMFQQSLQLDRDSTAQGARVRLLRDSTVIAANNDTRKILVSANSSSAVGLQIDAIQVVLDAPATTSSITYLTQARAEASNNNGLITLQRDGVASTMVLMEVVA